MIRYTPDAQWWRSNNGRGVLAGSPPHWFAVSDAGVAVLDALENGTELPTHHLTLTTRLAESGAIHPQRTQPVDPDTITVVIPVKAVSDTDNDMLRQQLSALHPLSVVIVDDASEVPVDNIDASQPHRHVIRRSVNGGPAAARNDGLARVATEYVAFVDTEVQVTSDQLCALAAHLRDNNADIVAPRIRAAMGSDLSEYESARDPLDMGLDTTLVTPQSRVPYVPAAVLVARTAALRTLNGFDADLRYGEDVDLIWRAHAAHLRCRYDATIECTHTPRSGLGGLCGQRFRYGTSAARLAQRHHGLVAPLRASAVSLVPAICWVSGQWPIAALTTVLAMTWHVVLLSRSSISLSMKMRIAWKSIVRTTAHTGTAIARTWWPLFLLTSGILPLVDAALTLSLFVPVIVGWYRHRPRKFLWWATCRIADDLSYGAGVWAGVFRTRSLRCLLPVVHVRPPSAH